MIYFIMYIVFTFFFFSSRRRHTRLQGDWSSDVCSSDLSTRWRICSNANVLTEEDVHNPFAGPTVPLLGNRAGASVAVENGVRFAEDAMPIGSDQDVGSD